MGRSVILTGRQNEVLKFVKEMYSKQDRLPTTPELKEKFGITDTHANYFIGVLMLKGAFGHKVKTTLTVAESVNRPSTAATVTVAAPQKKKYNISPQGLANLRASAAKARAAKLAKKQATDRIGNLAITLIHAGVAGDKVGGIINDMQKAGVKF